MNNNKSSEVQSISTDSTLTNYSQFKIIRTRNPSNVIMGNININSLSSKFDQLKVFIQGVFDIFIITETKLDDTFPISQFQIEGYSTPYRIDRNHRGGGVIIYVREDIPSKLLTSYVFPTDIEAIFLEKKTHTTNLVTVY